jgi:hypothetical protein
LDIFQAGRNFWKGFSLAFPNKQSLSKSSEISLSIKKFLPFTLSSSWVKRVAWISRGSPREKPFIFSDKIEPFDSQNIHMNKKNRQRAKNTKNTSGSKSTLSWPRTSHVMFRLVLRTRRIDLASPGRGALVHLSLN